MADPTLNPQIIEALHQIKTWLNEKNFEKVIQGCEEVLSADPNNTEAKSLLEQGKQGQAGGSTSAEAPTPGTPTENSSKDTFSLKEKAPAPETSAPETSAPETPAPETSAPEAPAPEAPAPETPAPETEPEIPGGLVAPETSESPSTAPTPAEKKLNFG